MISKCSKRFVSLAFGRSPESHQRSWWIVHIPPTKGLGASPSRIPPTQLVDCSYPAYKRTRSKPVPNPTNAVGGLFIPSLQKDWSKPVPNPTKAVGGLFIPSLKVSEFAFAARVSTIHQRVMDYRICWMAAAARLDMNDPPTALVGFREPACTG